MTRKKWVIGTIGALVLAGIAWANIAFNRSDAPAVTTEAVRRLDLEATVSASGKVEPKQSVDISAEVMGKVISLPVREGQTIARGQLLLEIDPRNLETQVQNREASLDVARSQLEQSRAQVETARVNLEQARDRLRREDELWAAGLIPREQHEQTANQVRIQETNLLVSQQAVQTQEQRIRQEEANLESAQYDLNKVRVVSPIDGIITRRNIEEGETAVVGTMNNAGTVLLTIADLSVIETEVDVDETEVPYIRVGQRAEVTIDAIPGQTFRGVVTEVGSSPVQTTGAANTQSATNFKVVVTIEGEVPDVRPGFTCTAVITTATREQALAVPIQAVTVRERVVDADGKMVPTPAGRSGAAATPTTVLPQDLPPGQTRQELEGVFLAREGRAVFTPVKLGIAGERHFEVLDGLAEGDLVITGPFADVRNLRDGDAVQATTGSTPSS